MQNILESFINQLFFAFEFGWEHAMESRALH